MPSKITAGEPITFNVSATLPTGNGQLRWTADGHKPVVAWDFDAEID